jgi:hypothetical protein
MLGGPLQQGRGKRGGIMHLKYATSKQLFTKRKLAGGYSGRKSAGFAEA